MNDLQWYCIGVVLVITILVCASLWYITGSDKPKE